MLHQSPVQADNRQEPLRHEPSRFEQFRLPGGDRIMHEGALSNKNDGPPRMIALSKAAVERATDNIEEPEVFT
jgi:hypothetical protein